jgi:hypothetical protein
VKTVGEKPAFWRRSVYGWGREKRRSGRDPSLLGRFSLTGIASHSRVRDPVPIRRENLVERLSGAEESLDRASATSPSRPREAFRYVSTPDRDSILGEGNGVDIARQIDGLPGFRWVPIGTPSRTNSALYIKGLWRPGTGSRLGAVSHPWYARLG